jgi:hypothetical protein
MKFCKISFYARIIFERLQSNPYKTLDLHPMVGACFLDFDLLLAGYSLVLGYLLWDFSCNDFMGLVHLNYKGNHCSLNESTRKTLIIKSVPGTSQKFSNIT